MWLSVAILGLVTNVAYGIAYYSYGVLIDPIHTTTGWSPAALGVIFSAVLVIGGVGGLAGGRLVDRLGSRPAFLIAAVVGSTGLAIASVPSGLAAFAVPYAIGCGVISALGFYHITQPTAMRAAGDQRDRAVVWLTVLGAFASAIFLPLTAPDPPPAAGAQAAREAPRRRRTPRCRRLSSSYGNHRAIRITRLAPDGACEIRAQPRLR